ncbi:glycosyl hydrolase family protein, partial [Acidobacteria bacterium ACD]|nr:glycosyl hydrolase family protein [Acidobacteria bacterium ACD]
MKAEGRLGEARWAVVLRAEAITDGSRGDLVLDPADRELRRSPLSVREAWVGIPLGGSLDLELGRFVLGWGKTDGYSPADAFLPRDLSDPYADEKLPVWGARLAGQAGPVRAELVGTVTATPWRLPVLSGRFAPVDTSDLALPVYLVDGEQDLPRTGFGALFEAIHNMLRCHAAAYHTIKQAYPASLVGTANNMQVFEARPGGNVADRWWAGQVSRLYNDSWQDALHTGRYRGVLGGRRFTNLAGTYDFVGINYYTRFYLRFPPPPGFVEREWGEGAIVSDGDYGEVYPYGLYRMMEHVWKRYQMPIFITENGVPDATDRIRPAFLLDHLRQVWHAISFCYPVMGYYHWSLVDNFEWDRGWTQRFGLVEVDPETQVRTWRPSAYLFREIAGSYTMTDDMAA